MAVLVRRHDGGRNPQRMQPVQRYQPFRELEEIQQQICPAGQMVVHETERRIAAQA